MTAEKEAELNRAKHDGMMADALLQGASRRLSEADEKQLLKQVELMTTSLNKLRVLIKQVVTLPDEDLYFRHEWTDPDMLGARSFREPYIQAALGTVTLSSAVRRAIAEHETVLDALNNEKNELRDRVVKAYRAKLPDLVRPKTPPPSLGEVPPFDPDVLDEILGR